jgi:hypothetical protein
MSRAFVGDVTVAVEIVEVVDPPEVVRRVFVAESSLCTTLGLRWRADGIFVGVERKSRHWGTSTCSQAMNKPELGSESEYATVNRLGTD